MTVPSPAEFPSQLPLSAVPNDALLAEAAAAARALAGALPSGETLTAGPPSRDRPETAPAGQAACAHFGGTASGEIVVVVGQDLIDALKGSPMGELDLAKAVQPALEAAVGTFGPVVVDPATVLDASTALDAMATTGAAVYVPLLDGGTTRAMLALIIGDKPPGAARAVHPPAAAAAGTGIGTGAGMGVGTGPGLPPMNRGGLELLHDVEMEVTAELGRTRMTVRELLSLTPGAIVELDRAAGSPADLLVNGRLIATGEVVIIDENFGLRITDISTSGERA
jgi:flagellar motor switch protein FliN/FliY